MIGAVCCKLNNEYEFRLYLLGTYNQIDWQTSMSCALGDNYIYHPYNKDCQRNDSLIITLDQNEKPLLSLFETKRYVINIKHTSKTEETIYPHFQNENNKFLKIEKDDNCVIFQFINYLGYSKIIFNQNNSDIQLNFEVIPNKMDYEKDYIALTEAIAKKCSELLLEYSGSTSNLFSQSLDTCKTSLEQFIFLRQFCYNQNILSLFASIKRNPDRFLNKNDILKPIGQGIPSKKFFTNPFSHSRNWVKINSNNSSVYLPQEVSISQKYDSIDTPANRFIKFALKKFDLICKKIMSSTEVEQVECFQEAKKIHTMITEIFNDNFFKNVGNLELIPQNNQVLQKREGYSQIFNAYSMIDLALQLNWKGKDKVFVGESKNVALLYEYWLFFELYNIIESIDGCKPIKVDKNDFLTICDEGLTISLQEGKKSCQSFTIQRLNTKINLYYNRTFSKNEFSSTSYEGSYSRAFRPDYTIAIFPHMYTGKKNGEVEAIKNGAVTFVHFDAKYRVNDLTSLIGSNSKKTDEEEIVEDKTNSIINTYNRGDLLKMHTYNDAIRRTVGSFILYPGKSEENINKKNTFKLYDEILPGVGAFSIRPSTHKKNENDLRKFITDLLETKSTLWSRLNRLNHFTEMVLREPKIELVNIKKSTSSNLTNTVYNDNDLYVLGNINPIYYKFLKEHNLLSTGSEFYFYFFAIKDNYIYSHHPDIIKINNFCFYIDSIKQSNVYSTEPILGSINFYELISKNELIEKLKKQGFETDEKNLIADFYYVLKIFVVNDETNKYIIDISKVNKENGNDTYSPLSPKVINLK